MTIKTGILLINLGTPDALTKPAIKRYLKEFLSDGRVVDIHPVARWLLVNGIILPFRTPKTLAAYAKVWEEDGSPLLLHSERFVEKLSGALGDASVVALGMRYGNPSIESAIDALMAQGISHLKIIPLFPQYASAAGGSAIAKALEILSGREAIPSFEVVDSFHSEPFFIDSLAMQMQPFWQAEQPDYLLMSYHGLPERQLRKLENTEGCVCTGECPALTLQNAACYRAQCYATSRALAQSLGLSDEQYGVSFQSRLGRIPWIQPYTDETLHRLREQGVKRLAVACPSFVVDCLETIEEIGMEARQEWLDLGGESFTLIPCLNDDGAWVQNFAGWVQGV